MNIAEPFFFGQPGRRLFGVYHPPRSETNSSLGVVLCYPTGEEYYLAHPTFVRLATLLATAGIHVLRFDYFGCGDSEGEAEDGSMEQWIADIQVAVDELRDGSGAKRLYLVGCRLSAYMAVATANLRADIDGIVLWDPVTNGVDYTKQLARQHNQRLRLEITKSVIKQQRGKPTEALGCRITDLMLREIECISLSSYSRIEAERALCIQTSRNSANTQLTEILKGAGPDFSHQYIPYSDGKIWWPGKSFVAPEVLEHIACWTGGVLDDRESSAVR
jgi:uncharacterized protein